MNNPRALNIKPQHLPIKANCVRPEQQGFTLIELLVVIALTVVLITLLFGPLIQGFQLTTEAQNETEAQNAARIAMEQISRECGSAALVRDTSHKYMNLDVYENPVPGVPSETLARAYAAYLDIEPSRSQELGPTNHIADPTVDATDPVFSIKNTSSAQVNNSAGGTRYALGVEVSNGVGLPVAPSPTIVRYFVGLRYPMNFNYTPGSTGIPQPYTNTSEHQILNSAEGSTFTSGVAGSPIPDVISKNLDNTYILYRAQVSAAAKLPTLVSNGGTYQYFDDKAGSEILDDPDFFRIVTTNDIDPQTGANYVDPRLTEHNDRVYRWYQAARPIVNVGNVNLIFQPHDGSNHVVYDEVTTDATYGLVAGTQTESDPVIPDPATTGNAWPVVRTSVSFEPTSISNDALSPTASSDVAQGFGSDPADANPYIPTEYSGKVGQWAGNPNIVVTIPGTTPTMVTTYVYNGPAKTNYSPGDIIETNPNPSPGTDLYNVSKNTLIAASIGNPLFPPTFAAMSLNGDPGNVNFSLPDLPIQTTDTNGTYAPVVIGQGPPVTFNNTVTYIGDADTSTVNNPFWFVTYGSNYGTTSGGFQQDGTTNTGPIPLQIHLKPLNPANFSGYVAADDQVLLPNAPLSVTNTMPNIANSSATGGIVVANSERVLGPEQDAGPGSQPQPGITNPMQMLLVPYRRVPYNPGGVSTIGPDQYMVDYTNGIIYLGGDYGATTSTGPINISDAAPQRRTVLVSFNWQNNAGAATANNPALTAATARASYQTGSKIAVSIGIRIFDPQTTHPNYFSLTDNVPVGNSNR